MTNNKAYEENLKYKIFEINTEIAKFRRLTEKFYEENSEKFIILPESDDVKGKFEIIGQTFMSANKQLKTNLEVISLIFKKIKIENFDEYFYLISYSIILNFIIFLDNFFCIKKIFESIKKNLNLTTLINEEKKVNYLYYLNDECNEIKNSSDIFLNYVHDSLCKLKKIRNALEHPLSYNVLDKKIKKPVIIANYKDLNFLNKETLAIIIQPIDEGNNNAFGQPEVLEGDINILDIFKIIFIYINQILESF